MARKRPEGECHICGRHGPLSFEHIPPRAAFNDRRAVVAKFEKAIRLGPDEVPRGPIQQRGMGGYTLCEKCNNDTGHWYGNQFLDWCYQGMDILNRSNGHPSLIYLYHLFPLPIIKQIATMFFSVNYFRKVQPELVQFVLNKERRFLPPKYRFFVYYNTTGRLRYAGITGVMTDVGGPDFEVKLVSEISFPPFGYVMTIDSEPPDKRLAEITQFARFAYDKIAETTVELPVLPTYSPAPGDYRDKAQIYRDAGIHADE